MATRPPHSMPRVPFAFRRESNAFSQALLEILHEIVRDHVRGTLDGANSLTLKHGRSWAIGEEGLPGAELEKSSVEVQASKDRFLNNDLKLLSEFLEQMTEGFVMQFTSRMYDILTRAANSVGNTIDARAQGTFSEGFLEMIRRVKFVVDKDGRVRLPELHLHPDVTERVLKELRSQPASYSRDVLVEKQHKKLRALEGEISRLQRFFVRAEENI